jgi:PncC family amidohydrolase
LDSNLLAESEPELALRVAALLSAAGQTLAVAESCTGGLLGAALTAIPGASNFFLGGVIAYDDRIKRALLQLPASVIAEHGAVSAECALLMASGVRDAVGADIGLSVTGIAGPTGGTPAKPVGTTYVALVTGDTERVKHVCWQGDREENRRLSVQSALRILLEHLCEPGVALRAFGAEVER